VSLKEKPLALVTASRGDDVVLKCSSIGIPAPVMSWYRDDIPLAQQKDDDITAGMMGETVTRLTLPCVTAGATYKCKAKAGRQEVTVVTKVEVDPSRLHSGRCLFKRDQPKILTWMETVMANEGKTVRLPCKQDGYDEKKVTWQDNMGALVRNGEHMQVTRDGDLEVKDVTWSDMGQFSCSTAQHTINTFLYPMAVEK